MVNDLTARMDRFAPFDPRYRGDDYSIAAAVANGAKATAEEVAAWEVDQAYMDQLRNDQQYLLHVERIAVERKRREQFTAYVKSVTFPREGIEPEKIGYDQFVSRGRRSELSKPPEPTTYNFSDVDLASADGEREIIYSNIAQADDMANAAGYVGNSWKTVLMDEFGGEDANEALRRALNSFSRPELVIVKKAGG